MIFLVVIMGNTFIDQYSLLHFAVGIIAYFWGISLQELFIIHLLFELIENTQFGMGIINTYFANIWPGGKEHADLLINSIGDNFFASIGWLVAYYVDNELKG
jgi:hypothetical protein